MKRAGLFIIGVLIIAGAIYAFQSSRSLPEGFDPIVRIGTGEVITEGRFNRSYVQLLMGSGRADSPAGRWAHLDALIRDRLLAREARSRGLDTLAAFRDLSDRVRRSSAGARYFEQAFAESLPALTEDELREAYRRTQDKVVLRHLFFQDRRLAEEAFDMLEEGESFLTLAQAVFLTPATDSLAGSLGLASYWDLDDAVAEAAFSTAVGDYTPPVRSRYGWHIIKVEDRFRQPLLSLSEYEARREGIRGQALVRRNRLQGDAFIRDMMQALDVFVEEDAARQLVETVQGAILPADVEGPSPGALSNQEIEFVRQQLAPESVLVTYELDGQQRRFTMADFVRWLPELPYDEVRDRPVAAVGRALRNEVLGLQGLERGLDESMQAREAQRHAEASFLADTLKGLLRAGPGVNPSEAVIQEAFEELGYGQLQEAEATYWVIEAATVPDAQRMLEQIRSGEVEPAWVSGYARYESVEIRRGPLAAYLRRIPQGEPTMVCLEGPRCLVVEVERRTQRFATLDDRREELRALLSRILPEEQLGDSLLNVVPVEVDSVRFMNMMKW